MMVLAGLCGAAPTASGCRHQNTISPIKSPEGVQIVCCVMHAKRRIPFNQIPGVYLANVVHVAT